MSDRVFDTCFFTAVLAIWIVYKMVLRKKRFSEIRVDAIAIVCFIAIWEVVMYLVNK